MSDDERQIRAIIDYIAEYLPEPEAGWPKKEFERVAYSRWAANEILASAIAHADWTPIRAVEEFKYMVSKYMYKPTNFTEVHFMFQTAYEVAVDISDILIAMIP